MKLFFLRDKGKGVVRRPVLVEDDLDVEQIADVPEPPPALPRYVAFPYLVTWILPCQVHHG